MQVHVFVLFLYFVLIKLGIFSEERIGTKYFFFFLCHRKHFDSLLALDGYYYLTPLSDFG